MFILLSYSSMPKMNFSQNLIPKCYVIGLLIIVLIESLTQYYLHFL